MSTYAPSVYQDKNGSWFVRCGACHAFWGSFRNETDAKASLYRHNLRQHA